MPITPAEVRRVAELAGLELSDDEVEVMARELAGILEHVEALTEVEGDVPGGATPAGTGLRADAPDRDELVFGVQRLAAAARDGFVVVPREAASGTDR